MAECFPARPLIADTDFGAPGDKVGEKSDLTKLHDAVGRQGGNQSRSSSVGSREGRGIATVQMNNRPGFDLHALRRAPDADGTSLVGGDLRLILPLGVTTLRLSGLYAPESSRLG